MTQGEALPTRLGAAVAITASVGFPLVGVGLSTMSEVPALLPTAIVTACYLPLLLRLVLPALHGRRPRYAGWTVVAMAAIVLLGMPYAGVHTLPMLAMVAVAAMLVIRMPWSFVVMAAIAVATVPLAYMLDRGLNVYWYPVVVMWRSTTLFVLIWLVAAARRLDQARREVAGKALLRERVRIDDELHRTVGAALAELVVRGERVRALAGSEAPPAELAELAAASRRTLAEARRIVRRYQEPSLGAELATASALLGAAGIAARAVLPAGDVPPDAEDTLRADLHAATSRLLLDGAADRSVVLEVVVDGDSPRLDVLPDAIDPRATR